MQKPTSQLISSAEAAEILNYHVATINRMVAAGKLTPAIKLPGKTGAYLFNRADIEALHAPAN